LQHYGVKLTVSAKIKASLQAIQLEVGCRGNPFDEDFGAIGVLATECWIKFIWERMWLYNFRLYLDDPMMAFPRVGIITIVDLLLGHGIQGATLGGYNQCQLNHEAVFLSDIATAAGTHVDPQYLQPPTRKGQISFYNFPHDEPIR
jgi:hypothetical protein